MKFKEKFAIASVLAAGIFVGGVLAAMGAGPAFPYATGGTGSSTVPATGQVIYAGPTAYQSVATTSVSCSGSASCTVFTAIGPSPITITGTGASFPFTAATNFAVNTSATTTSIWDKVSIFASTTGATPSWLDQLNIGSTTQSKGTATSTFAGSINMTGNASTSQLVISNVVSALLLNGSSGTVGAYAGSSGVCTNQVPESLSAVGALGTCTSINNAWWSGAQLTVGNGGTGQTTFTSSQLLYGNGGNALSSVATTTISGGTTGLSFSNSPVVIGTSGSSLSGTLVTANGGTNHGNYTAGSIIFAGAGGTSLTENNARFFWDNTNEREGVGTSTPWAKLSVHGNPTDAAFSNTLFAVASSTATATTTLLSTTNGGQTATCETVFGNTTNGATYASSTSMTVNMDETCNQVLFQIGSAAVTITLTNFSVGDTKRLIIANPKGTAGTVSWVGAAWIGGTAPTQTTTANQGDIYSCIGTQATSTTATAKLDCTSSTGLQ